jgi:uncharacterized membrane protein YciS (DUF1049 family)
MAIAIVIMRTLFVISIALGDGNNKITSVRFRRMKLAANGDIELTLKSVLY